MSKSIVYFQDDPTGIRSILKRHDAHEVAEYDRSILIRSDDAGVEELRSEGFRVRDLPDRPILSRGGFDLDTAAIAEVSAAGVALETVTSEPAVPTASHSIIRIAGPMHRDWSEALAAAGIKIYESLAEHWYLVGGEEPALEQVAGLEYVESVTPYPPPFKVAPELLTAELQTNLAAAPGIAAVALEAMPEPEAPAELTDFDVLRSSAAEPAEVGNLELILFEAEDQPAVTDRLHQLGVEIFTFQDDYFIVFAPLDLIPELAAISQVREINPYREATLHNNVASGIVGVDTVRDNHGLDGNGEIVAVADSGLDRGVDDDTMSADFRDRIVSIHALGRPPEDASDLHNHGTHVAGSVLGSGTNSNGKIRGMAPQAQLVFQSVMDANRSLSGLPPNLESGLFDVARDDGASIHTNSWGRDLNGLYDIRSRQTDRFAFKNRNFLILFSAGNEAPRRTTAPGTAKNVLTVGASDSVRPLPASVNFPPSPKRPAGVTLHLGQTADNADQVASFSCPGPAGGERLKPDVVAPGTFILSTRSAVSTADTGPDGLPKTFDEDSVFTHAEAVGRGLPGGPLLGGGDRNTPDAPPGSGAQARENYYYDSGTSMATPITAGTCALVRQFLRERGHIPSAALLKALIVNGARAIGDSAPDHSQGWGRVDLERTLFPAGPNSVQFDDTLDHAVTSGEIRTYRFSPLDVAQPIAVTLVWRDAEGATLQNRLHLRVIDPSEVRHESEAENQVRNNVQKVEITPTIDGVYTIEVDSVSVSRGVPELPDLRQDFALVVANAGELAMAF